MLQKAVSVGAAVMVRVDRVGHERLREVGQCAAFLVNWGLVLAHLGILVCFAFVGT